MIYILVRILFALVAVTMIYFSYRDAWVFIKADYVETIMEQQAFFLRAILFAIYALISTMIALLFKKN